MKQRIGFLLLVLLLEPSFEASAQPVERPALPDFARSDHTIPVARALRSLLGDLAYEAALARLYGADHKVLTLYEGPPLDDPDELVGVVAGRASGLTPRQARALRFFHLGEALAESDVATLFGASRRSLLADLMRLELIVEIAPERLAMNDLSLIAYRLTGGSTLYLLVDLPDRLRRSAGRATAQISATSNILLHRLELLAAEASFDISGIAADFGSGSGVQALALLLLYPGIELAYGLEIDAHSSNLAIFAAALNGVEERFVGVDNRDADNLPAALDGKRIEFAVSNPPSNIIPSSLSSHFAEFGDGGPTGLDITAIFLAQVAKTLAPGGHFLFFSQLAAGRDGLLVEKLFEGTPLSSSFEPANLQAWIYPPERLPRYCSDLRHFAEGLGATSLPSVEELLAELRETQVDEIKLGFVIAKRDGAGSLPNFPRKPLVGLEPFQLRYGAISHSR